MSDWYAIGSYVAAGSGERTGLILSDRRLYDCEDVVRAAALAADHAALLRAGLVAMLGAWEQASRALSAIATAAETAVKRGTLAPSIATPRRMLPPYRPTRLFCAAANYREHAAEMKSQLAPREESQPYFFMKADSAVIGDGEPVRLPPSSNKVDWEVELAAVIGRGGRNIAERDALSHVAGYTIVNDVSARDLNIRSDFPFKHDWFRGKSWDTFAPLGPWFVPAGLVGDPQRLRLRLDINGQTMQDQTSAGMIFSVAEQIAYLSTVLTLRPGDLIATGTPDGVGMGRGVFLKAGDRMRASIEKIGDLENPVVAG